MSKISTKYHYFYKITNNINGHFYYGIHNTNNLDDGYMGSGTRLHYAYKKYGIENFTKEILKFFDTSKEAFEYEADVVNEELVKDSNCYNIKRGGEGWLTIGLTAVKDKYGNSFCTYIDDERLKTGELVHYNKNITTYCDSNGNTCRTTKDDERVINGELHGILLNKICVKDNNGNYFIVSKDDERYLSGKLKQNTVGVKHSKLTKEKIKISLKHIHHQQGEKNSQYGTCWIHNNNENKKIKKEQLEEYISNGWIKGRKMKF